MAYVLLNFETTPSLLISRTLISIERLRRSKFNFDVRAKTTKTDRVYLSLISEIT